MEKLLKLFSYCKAEVMITYNGHKSCYESVEDYVAGWGNRDKREYIPDDVFEEMVRRDTVIELQYYPNTPVGFNLILHYDLEKAVDMALEGWIITIPITNSPDATPARIA